MSKSDYPLAAEAESDMKSHGEVHCVFEEFDSEIELVGSNGFQIREWRSYRS